MVRDVEAGPGALLEDPSQSNPIWPDAALAKEEGANQRICVFKKDDFEIGASRSEATEHGKAVHFEYDKAGDEVWTAGLRRAR